MKLKLKKFIALIKIIIPFTQITIKNIKMVWSEIDAGHKK